MAKNIAQDKIVSTEQRNKNARRILEEAIKEEALRRESDRRVLSPTEIWPAGTFNTEPLPKLPDNLLYNTLINPKLNRGLSNLIESASDVLFGRESGNSLVDLGTSNIPGVGAASILAAGGIPGLVDAVGAGELRNLKKIPKYTYEFVKEFFGDRGLKNLDNALTKYPKAEKPSVNDALYLMRTGMGGEKVNAIKPYSSGDVAGDMADLLGFENATSFMNRRRLDLEYVLNGNNDRAKTLAKQAYKALENSIDSGDMKGAMNASSALLSLAMGGSNIDNAKLSILAKSLDKPVSFGEMFKTNKRVSQMSPDLYDRMRHYKEITESPLQDWETIARKQELKDARDIEKLAKKQAKINPDEVKKVVQEILEEVPPEVHGGPNLWKENGWNPNVRTDDFYRQFGGKLTDNSKRDAFVMDSLANHWAGKIRGNGRDGSFASAIITDALSRADARHRLSNYDEVSRGFYDDIKKNIASGNMPGTSVMFGPKYKRNVRTDRDTPTLILSPEEKPKYYNDMRIWADEQDGPDIYEMLFRPKADEMLNALNPEYWLYKSRKR